MISSVYLICLRFVGLVCIAVSRRVQQRDAEMQTLKNEKDKLSTKLDQTIIGRCCVIKLFLFFFPEI